jgi:hypothetical protein
MVDPPDPDVIVIGWYRYHYRRQGAQVKCATQHRPPGTIAAGNDGTGALNFPAFSKFAVFPGPCPRSRQSLRCNCPQRALMAHIAFPKL